MHVVRLSIRAAERVRCLQCLLSDPALGLLHHRGTILKVLWHEMQHLTQFTFCVLVLAKCALNPDVCKASTSMLSIHLIAMISNVYWLSALTKVSVPCADPCHCNFCAVFTIRARYYSDCHNASFTRGQLFMPQSASLSIVGVNNQLTIQKQFLVL